MGGEMGAAVGFGIRRSHNREGSKGARKFSLGRASPPCRGGRGGRSGKVAVKAPTVTHEPRQFVACTQSPLPGGYRMRRSERRAEICAFAPAKASLQRSLSLAGL